MRLKTAIVRAALFTPYTKGRWGIPLLSWSNPGEGKTSIHEEICESYDSLPCVTLSPAEMGEGAFGVIPVPDKSGVIKYPPPEWVAHVREGGVVFIDEMSSTPPALQAPLLGLLFARRIGGHVLGPRVRIIGAANPPEVAASGFELAPPVANRCGHLEWSAPSVAEHTAYMLRGTTGHGGEGAPKTDAKAEETRVLELWPGAFARAVGQETAFLARRPELKNKCPKVGDASAGRAWPSDRSWENATRALASAYVHKLAEVETEEFVAAFIGAGAASEFFGWLKTQDLPDPAAVLDGQEKFTHSSARLDRTAAVLNSCVSLVAPKNAPRRKERAESLWRLIEDLTTTKTDLDLFVPAIFSLVQADLHTLPVAAKPLSRLAVTVTAAGIKLR